MMVQMPVQQPRAPGILLRREGLSRNSFYMIILLTAIWIILRESVSILAVAAGLAISFCCVFFFHRFIPLPKSEPIRPFRLVIYVFYLLGQIYIGGIAAIGIILFGARVDIVEMKTRIRSKVLRTILVNSITLVPGSVSLDLNEDTITVLWLTRKTDGAADIKKTGELLKGKLERMLFKVQK